MVFPAAVQEHHTLAWRLAGSSLQVSFAHRNSEEFPHHGIRYNVMVTILSATESLA